MTRTTVLVTISVLIGACTSSLQAQDFATQAWEQEEAIAECMAERGFTYVPWVNLDEDAALGGAAEPGENPNDPILAQLDPETAEGYAVAYWGEDSARLGDLDPANKGCVSRATEEVFGTMPDLSVQRADMISLSQSVEGDPRVVAATGEWRSCMADQGFDVVNRRSMFDQLTMFESEVADEPITVDGVAVNPPAMFDADKRCAETLIPILDEVRNELLAEYWATHR